jgi:energy-coupling factor transporter ATP-binding protein EcfA2
MLRLQFNMKGRSATIELQRIAVLLGPNGSGKSTISDALCLALVGESYDLYWREKVKAGRLLKYIGRDDVCFSKVTNTFSGEEWEWRIDQKRRSPRDYVERIRPWRKALAGSPGTLYGYLGDVLECDSLMEYTTVKEQLYLSTKANKETAAYVKSCKRFVESLTSKGDSTSRLNQIETTYALSSKQIKQFKDLLSEKLDKLKGEVNESMPLLVGAANNFMPDRDKIRWDAEDGVFFLQKNGVDCYALSKSEETRVVGSLALGCQDTMDSILVLEDRGWDGKNLRETLKLWSESCAARIIIQSTVKPAARPYKNVTYARTDVLFADLTNTHWEE